jgi:hypothetical protein
MLMRHPLTDIGLKKFVDDWNKSGAKIQAEARERHGGSV